MANVTRVQKYGNNLAVIFDDGTQKFAYPTVGGIWLVSGTGGGTTSPPGGLWQWPIDTSVCTVTDPYGNRTDPVTGEPEFHAGIDFSSASFLGTPIWAAAAGTVVQIGDNTGAIGFAVGLKHSDNSETLYFHLQYLPPVAVGDTVTEGQVIGYGNNTGSSTGSHLHFQCQTSVNESSSYTVDPVIYMRDRGAPELP